MARIYFAVVQGGVLVGDFARVADVDLAGDVDALKQRVKVMRGAELAGIEPWHMTVIGPWEAKPHVADVARFVGEEPCDPTAILRDLIGDKKCVFFIVRIPTPPSVTAAGAGSNAAGERDSSEGTQGVICAWVAFLLPSLCLSRDFYLSHRSDA